MLKVGVADLRGEQPAKRTPVYFLSLKLAWKTNTLHSTRTQISSNRTAWLTLITKKTSLTTPIPRLYTVYSVNIAAVYLMCTVSTP